MLDVINESLVAADVEINEHVLTFGGTARNVCTNWKKPAGERQKMLPRTGVPSCREYW
jgi:hypothetical protein